jgi:hypothetical protein
MSGLPYTVEIDRLVLTGLDLTPAQAELVRARLAGELERLLTQRGWASDVADMRVARLDLPEVSLGEPPDEGRLAGMLAQRLAQALPGTRLAEPRSPGNG